MLRGIISEVRDKTNPLISTPHWEYRKKSNSFSARSIAPIPLTSVRCFMFWQHLLMFLNFIMPIIRNQEIALVRDRERRKIISEGRGDYYITSDASLKSFRKLVASKNLVRMASFWTQFFLLDVFSSNLDTLNCKIFSFPFMVFWINLEWYGSVPKRNEAVLLVNFSGYVNSYQ